MPLRALDARLAASMRCCRLARASLRASCCAQPSTGQPPEHVALILDGNARWARKRGLSLADGHMAGAEALVKTALRCSSLGVARLSAFALSSDNLSGRPPAELASLFDTIARVLVAETPALAARSVRLRFASTAPESLPTTLRAVMTATAALTERNTGLLVTIYLAYSGRSNLLLATQELLRRQLPPAEVDAALFARLLRETSIPPGWAGGLPVENHAEEPDLLIRTGEARLSDFLLYEVAWSEIAFLENTLWPDFGEAELRSAFETFAGRERRFGKRHSEAAR